MKSFEMLFTCGKLVGVWRMAGDPQAKVKLSEEETTALEAVMSPYTEESSKPITAKRAVKIGASCARGNCD